MPPKLEKFLHISVLVLVPVVIIIAAEMPR